MKAPVAAALIALTSITLTIIVAPPALALDQAKLIDVVTKTGMGHSFKSFSKGVVMGMEQLPPDTANRASVIAAAGVAADAAFNAEALQKGLLSGLTEKLSDADLDAVLKFYDTPLAQQMTAWENASQTPEVHEEVRKQAPAIMAQLAADKPRADLIKGIDDSLQITQSSVDSAMMFQRATLIGMISAKEGGKPDMTLVDKIMEQARPQVAHAVGTMIVPALAHTYREASNEDLKTYLEFLSSPTGQKLYGSGRDVRNRILINACLDFGEQFGKGLKE